MLYCQHFSSYNLHFLPPLHRSHWDNLHVIGGGSVQIKINDVVYVDDSRLHSLIIKIRS